MWPHVTRVHNIGSASLDGPAGSFVGLWKWLGEEKELGFFFRLIP